MNYLEQVETLAIKTTWNLILKKKIELKDFRKEIINYLDINFKGNENFIKIVKNSVFCSEDNNIVSDDFMIIKDQKIGIIPPIGGG